MKTTIRTCGLLTLACILPLSAEEVTRTTETTETTETSRGTDGSVTETTTTTTTTFNPEVRTKVVTYFDQY
jgi:hypothetical protein